jgi:hypothetical protein
VFSFVFYSLICFYRTDPDRPYKFYDLSKDVDDLLSGMQEGHYNMGFTVVKNWPPEQEKKQVVPEGDNDVLFA